MLLKGTAVMMYSQTGRVHAPASNDTRILI